MLTPHFRGHEFDHLSFASSLCGGCTAVCPVKIDLHHHLLQNRRNSVQADQRPWSERMSFRFWRWMMMSSGRFSAFSKLGRAGIRMAQGNRHRSAEALDRLPRRAGVTGKSFRDMWRDGNV